MVQDRPHMRAEEEEAVPAIFQTGRDLLPDITKLADAYPYPHGVLGRAGAGRYVEGLAARAQYPGEGWYAATLDGEVVAAAHLSVYGVGDRSGHTLWKIRHPLLADGRTADYLRLLLETLTGVAVRLRIGTAKLVIFLSEYETEVIAQAHNAGFQCEGRFRDYYRLGETCLVYGRTVS
jgi:hypothetical protein